MNTTEPDFMEWVEVDVDGWKLKKNAPENIKNKFYNYMQQINLCIIEVDMEDE